MNELVKTFGYNAGKVWKILEKEGPIGPIKLKRKTQLRDDEFFGAIGWLARENKIFFDNKTYFIGETNLTDKIGNYAGKVWESLEYGKEIDVSAIARLSQLEKQDCYTALGWLAREGKLITKTKIKKK
ncbi:MAG: winged helix-turn-helix domain-containing protein [Candidatus Thermoplasmatota archaeon]|nr:winged helix-turn-helix domain-containing protein [Candidatus Thermoplasmatota archaeon]MBU1941203.1 winged helix-turn-helix domain-containing protein [Candidatus Thermoplasmatota archaeon]